MVHFIKLQMFLKENPALWVIVFLILFIISESVSILIDKKNIKRKTAIAFGFSVFFTLVTLVLNILFPTPEIKRPPSIIPSNITKSHLKIVLYEYQGEYYYQKNTNKNCIYKTLDNKNAQITVRNKDYEVDFTEYKSEINENGEAIYIFDNIPAGNYTISVSLDGYLINTGDYLFETSKRSFRNDENEYWFDASVYMRKIDTENLIPMKISFLDKDYKPLKDLKYEIVKSSISTNMQHYDYIYSTDSEGRCEEIINIIPESKISIAYINPYSNEEKTFLITSTIDPVIKWCDILLILDKNGNIVQTSPSLIYNY